MSSAAKDEPGPGPTNVDNSVDPSSQYSPEDLIARSCIEKSSCCSALPLYSIFTKRQKWLTIFLATFAGAFSPLSSFIFFPVVTNLSNSLHVSIAKINLTITSYMIVAGIAPSILGDLADNVGRRMVYILMMAIYCAANIGLALQNSWTALFILRMVQSSGSAATIALGYGVVADIATPAERSEFVSGMVLGPNIATAIGPIVGGALAEYAGWRWIFWLLAALSGICLLFVILLLPETARSIVGNGSKPATGLHRPIASLAFATKSFTKRSEQGAAKPVAPIKEEAASRVFHVPNPLQSLRLLCAKDCILIVLIFGIFYMNLSCVQASTSALFIKIYHISELKAGLAYLPAGVGSIIGAYGAGPLLKYDYGMTARKHGIEINVRSGDDMSVFPIEQARLRSIWYSIGSAALSTIGYGWALHSKAHMAVPLALQFLIGLSTAIIFNSSATLLTDIHPKSPSTASAANSIVRCLLAGLGLAVVQILIDSIGIHWCFTLFGIICLACLGVAWLLCNYGRLWRDEIRTRNVER
ncbi:major facilitator superfamily domain-containing protein [Lophiotrema nucula]|uniref:Major facilitator superfamily domain-containing protein n=1 Tax=Lophiotrema nucula TaxID=690887 RepID=A0A6A5Z7J6_9PLEO|nr:major facilitator superfamily domain-containing protein [Lophiotrema nucula]